MTGISNVGGGGQADRTPPPKALSPAQKKDLEELQQLSGKVDSTPKVVSNLAAPGKSDLPGRTVLMSDKDPDMQTQFKNKSYKVTHRI